MNIRETARSRPISCRFGFLPLTFGFLVCCTNPQDPTEPAHSIEGQGQPVEAEGTRFAALAYGNRELAEAAFGFDIHGAGLLPLRITIDNHGGGPMKIIPRQTFLIDLDSQAWPLLTANQAFNRLDRAAALAHGNIHPYRPENPDSITGFALDVVSAPSSPGKVDADAKPESRIRQNLTEKTPHNPRITPGEAASGILFFPGQEEARGARGLRLCYEQDGRLKFLTLPLEPSPPLASSP